MTYKPDHKIIFLVPDDEESWLWCEDPAPGIDMLESESIKYIRADAIEEYLAKQPKPCEHEWVNADNKVCTGALICTLCNEIRSSSYHPQ